MALMRLDRTKSWEAILTSLARSALRPGELARRRRHERLDEIEVETSTDPASPPIRAIPAHAIANALNDQGLAAEYAELLSGFGRTGIMERERLRRIGSALGFRYVLLPGLAQLDQAILDRLEIAGVKVVRTRVTVLRVWLQLWDTRTGHILWESAGDVATASDVVRHDRIVPIEEIAEKLWRRMIQHDLLEGGTGSRSLLDF